LREYNHSSKTTNTISSNINNSNNDCPEIAYPVKLSDARDSAAWVFIHFTKHSNCPRTWSPGGLVLVSWGQVTYQL